MRFHNQGKYNGDEASLPQRDIENAIPFKEGKDMKTIALIANAGSVVTMLILAIPVCFLGKEYLLENDLSFGIGCILPMFTLVPHEFLHALCFQEDVYMYSNLKQLVMFVVGCEDMSRTRFVLMSLCPNIVFGFIPYLIFLIHPAFVGLGAFGMICIGCGFGDYMNIFHALTQMPKGAVTFMSGMHSYWYIPEKNNS